MTGFCGTLGFKSSGRLANRNATINVTSFGRKRETFCDMQNFNLEGSDDEYVSLIRKLKESGTEAVASKAFFLQPDAAFQDDGLSP